MKMVSRVLAFLVLLTLPFAGVLAGVYVVVTGKLLADAQKVKAGWTPARAVLWWAWVWGKVYSVPWSLSLAILRNEGASVAKDGAYPLGDVGHRWGPAVGSGQVLKMNVDRLWAKAGALGPLVKASTATDLAREGHERGALWVSTKVMRECLDASKGDEHDAARFYNGGTGATENNDAAETYADNADASRARVGDTA
jgi:hypothetical protein